MATKCFKHNLDGPTLIEIAKDEPIECTDDRVFAEDEAEARLKVEIYYVLLDAWGKAKKLKKTTLKNKIDKLIDQALK